MIAHFCFLSEREQVVGGKETDQFPVGQTLRTDCIKWCCSCGHGYVAALAQLGRRPNGEATAHKNESDRDVGEKEEEDKISQARLWSLLPAPQPPARPAIKT